MIMDKQTCTGNRKTLLPAEWQSQSWRCQLWIPGWNGEAAIFSFPQQQNSNKGTLPLDSGSSEGHHRSPEWQALAGSPAPLLKVVQPEFVSPCLLHPSLHQCPAHVASPHLFNTTLNTYSTRMPYRGVTEKLCSCHGDSSGEEASELAISWMWT